MLFDIVFLYLNKMFGIFLFTLFSPLWSANLKFTLMNFITILDSKIHKNHSVWIWKSKWVEKYSVSWFHYSISDTYIMYNIKEQQYMPVSDTIDQVLGSTKVFYGLVVLSAFSFCCSKTKNSENAIVLFSWLHPLF